MRKTRLASVESCASACSSISSCSSFGVERVRDDSRQSRPHFGMIAVADSLDQQIPKRPTLENHLAKNVENLTVESFLRLVQLLQQGQVDLAFSGLFSDQV